MARTLISRRKLLKTGAASLAAAGLAGYAPRVMPIKAATPKMGNHMRAGLGHGSTTDSLDPATYGNGFTIALNFATHNHISEVGVTGDLIPELAEGWEASNDAATWHFKIRQGVEFHNGKTLTVEDVVASIDHHRGEDSESAVKPLLEPITDIKIDGKDTVVISLDGGNADFPFIISDYHVAILPSKDGAVDWRSGAGTGGYVLENFEPGARADFTRNPNYWKEGYGHFDSLEIRSIIDVVARTNALTRGEIDLMDRCDLKTLHLLERNTDVRIEETTGTAHYSIPMRTDTPPYHGRAHVEHGAALGERLVVAARL